MLLKFCDICLKPFTHLFNLYLNFNEQKYIGVMHVWKYVKVQGDQEEKKQRKSASWEIICDLLKCYAP